MRNLAIITLLALLVTGSRGFAAPKTFVSENGRFTCKVDSKLKSDTKTIATKSGNLEVTTESAAISNEQILSVSFADLTDSSGTLDSEKIITNAILAMTKSGALGEQLTIEEKDSTPAGVEVRLQHGKIHTRARLYLSGNRLYIVSVIGIPSKVTDKVAESFFEHFAIVP
jgi:hypothetical protein